MSFLDASSVRGPAYAVGYGIGQIAALWKMSRDLSQVGCSDKNLAKCLSLSLEHVQAAREIAGPYDKRATAVLRQVIGDIVTAAYHETIDEHAVETIAKNEAIICKALILDPDALNYFPVF